MNNRNFNDPEYKKWRQQIYSRDKHCCRWPGCNNKKKLQAHHICRWVDNPGLRFHLYNGITLCKTHHDMIKNNEDYYREFFTRLIYTTINDIK